ncbi:MAG: DNA repair protein RadA [Clostridiales Family XIII bacterium]|jgi:DNA repair protein RadA/Sms|nr:DNA repair protein RadA [Clostridiales Family XIII bacterium]
MATKPVSVFVCNECGYESAKWMGQCICGAWNSFSEERIRKTPTSKANDMARKSFNAAQPKPLADVSTLSRIRIDTKIGELNRVLGGGIVPGSLILIAGEPGIGKSTLILQAAIHLALSGQKILYVSGEESEEQIRLRADRLCPGESDIPPELLILSETNMEPLDDIIQAMHPDLLIIDSIQTMYTEMSVSVAGSVSQVRACTGELMHIAKSTQIPILIVAHVTKSGDLAGPKMIEHLVDCVLQFTGDRNQDLRILRANKNRFGATSEIGAFEMREEGLAEVENLSGSLLEGMDTEAEGAVATAVYEGTRPLLLEIQALTSPSGVGFARRTPIGIELSRLNMIVAVLERKAKLSLADKDVYVNVVGGIRPEGTSFDLAVALAIYSSAKGLTVSPNTLAIGEIGLTGELRQVKGAEKIVREAAKLGFDRILLAKKSADKIGAVPGLQCIGVSTVLEAIQAL